MGEYLRDLITIADYEKALYEFRAALTESRLGVRGGPRVTKAIDTALIARIAELRLAAKFAAAQHDDAQREGEG